MTAFFANLKSFCVDNIGWFCGDRIPVRLCHYTTAGGLIGIVQEKKIYSTNIAYLNDSLEFRHAIDALQSAFKNYGIHADGAPLREMTEEFISRSLPMIQDLSEKDIPPHFVTCFSEKNDDLDLWRAYCGSEQGYCLVFDSWLATPIVDRGHRIMRCVYDEIQHRDLFIRLIRAADTDIRVLMDTGQKFGGDYIIECVRHFMEILLYFSPLIKHSKFASENETRAVTHLGRPNKQEKIKYRPKGDLFCPYTLLPLNFEKAGVERGFPLVEVVVGPGRHKNLNISAVRNFLSEQNLDSVVVRPSEVPYRLA